MKKTLFAKDEAIEICGAELVSEASATEIQTPKKYYRPQGYYIMTGIPAASDTYKCIAVYMVYMNGIVNEVVQKNNCKLIGFWIDEKKWSSLPIPIYEVRSYEITRYEGTKPIYEDVVYLRTDDQMEAIAEQRKLVSEGHQYAMVVPQNQGYKNDTGKKK